MEIIYPEETLQLLVKCDAFLSCIADEYKRLYPPDRFPDMWYRKMQNDPFYQAGIRQKTKIILMSLPTYRIAREDLQGLLGTE